MGNNREHSIHPIAMPECKSGSDVQIKRLPDVCARIEQKLRSEKKASKCTLTSPIPTTSFPHFSNNPEIFVTSGSAIRDNRFQMQCDAFADAPHESFMRRHGKGISHTDKLTRSYRSPLDFDVEETP